MSTEPNALMNLISDAQRLMTQRRVEALSATSTAPSAAASEAKTPTVKSTEYIGARDNRDDFFETWGRKIEAFVQDSTRTSLDMPSELNSNDRRVLHQLADKFNLSHMSAGRGTDRRLVLRKDSIFYSTSATMIDRDGISSLKSRDESARGNRFRLKHVTTGDAATYADQSAAGALKRLEKATDMYAHAVESHSTGNANPAAMGPAHAKPPQSRGAPLHLQSSTPAAPAAPAPAPAPAPWQQAMAPQPGSAKVAVSSTVAHDEVCTSCGRTNPLDYDVGDWESVGACPVCKRDTVWRLVERRKATVQVAALSVTPQAPTPAPTAGHKRDRSPSANDRPALRATPAAVSDAPDAADDLEECPMDTEDVITMLECNEYTGEDIAWMKRFCTHTLQDDADTIGKHVILCTALADMPRRTATSFHIRAPVGRPLAPVLDALAAQDPRPFIGLLNIPVAAIGAEGLVYVAGGVSLGPAFAEYVVSATPQ